MDVLNKANAINNEKRIVIEPLNPKKPRGRPKLTPSKRKTKVTKTGGVETHIMTEARKKMLKRAHVARSLKAEEKRKAKQNSEGISKSSMFPNPKENFSITDENHDESKILLNPEVIVNPNKPQPFSNGTNQIEQYELKLQELGKQYTSEIEGLKQQVDRLVNKPKKPRTKKQLPNNDNVVNGEGDIRQGTLVRDIYDNSTMNKHSGIYNASPFQHIHAFHSNLGNNMGVGRYTGQAPVQEGGFQVRF